MSHRYQIEKIEEYHRGTMSSEEMAAFERDLAADPSLKAESDLQSQIIGGLKEYRKTQLKARLDAIDVAPGWIEFAQQSALVKSFGGIAIATLIGTGVLLLGEDKSEELSYESTATIAMSVPAQEEFVFDWNIEAPEVVAVATVELSKKEVATEDVVKSEETPVKVVVAEEPNQKEFSPAFVAPGAGDAADETDLTTSSLDEVTESTIVEAERKPIDVETENSRGAKIRYKYYDGKLYLSGDFRDKPYEILEINSAQGRRIYLLHQNRFYEVGTTDRLKELPEVTDVKLIQELRLIRENK